jgi:fumarate reductase subunit D
VLVLVTLLAALGHVPEALSYENLHAFAAHWLGKLIIFGVIFLSLWHAAHRLRITLHDFGIRADGLVATAVYVLAAIGTVLCILYLLRI